jgi:hypothetical protein
MIKQFYAKYYRKSYNFAIHGGCIRDAISHIIPYDYDIVFSTPSYVAQFVRFFKCVEILDKHTAYGGKYSIIIDGKRIILDICAQSHGLLALDYTVNGLYVDISGNLKSKSMFYGVDVILQDIVWFQ